MRGSFGCFASLAHSGQMLTKDVRHLVRPGHQTDILALSLDLTIPWCPACSFSRALSWRALGTTILRPYMRSPSPSVNSL